VKINIVCQHCHTKLAIKTTLLGQKIRCPHCQEKIRLISPDANPKAVKTQRPISQDDSEEDENWDVGSDELLTNVNRSAPLDDDDNFVPPTNRVRQKKAEPTTRARRSRPIESDSFDEVVASQDEAKPDWRPLASVGVTGIILGILFGFFVRSQQGSDAVHEQVINSAHASAPIENTTDRRPKRAEQIEDHQPANDEIHSVPEFTSTPSAQREKDNAEPESTPDSNSDHTAPSP
jgi:uncharacterized Zn finger protein (UPF0148 family)